MSKQIKKMEMDALRETFQGIRDLVMEVCCARV